MLSNILCQFILYSINIKKDFPNLSFTGTLLDEDKKQLLKQIIASGLSKLRNVTRNSFDSVFISFFLGLTLLAKYQNYYQVLLLPMTVLSLLHGAYMIGLGNGIAVENSNSNYESLKLYTLLQSIIVTVMISVMINMYQPFISLWIGKEYLLDNNYVLLFCLYFYVLSIIDTSILLRESTGIWWKGKFISLIEAVMNILLNYLLIKYIGLAGVIISTIVVVSVISIPFEYYYVFKNYFHKDIIDYFLIVLKNTLFTVIVISLCVLITINIPANGILFLILKTILITFISLLFSILFHVKDKELYSVLRTIKIAFIGNENL